jgi:HSP20 family protein
MVEKSHTAGWWPTLYEPLRSIGQKVADWVAPRSDASALEDSYEITMELPGVKPDDIDVSVHDNALVISGEKRFEHEQKGRTYFFSEREYGAFQRTFRLPPDTDGGKVDAQFKDGVLSVKVPKAAPSKPPGQKVEIKTG